MEVLDREQLQFSGVDPCAALAGPAFRAVAIAARIVAVLFTGTVVASVAMPAQFLGAAFGDRRQRLVLFRCQSVIGAIGRAVFPKDITDLERWIGRVRREGFNRGGIRICPVHTLKYRRGCVALIYPQILGLQYSCILLFFSDDLVQRQNQPPT